LTDPPYGINFRSNSRTATSKFNKIQNDAVIDTAWIGQAVDRLGRRLRGLYCNPVGRVALLGASCGELLHVKDCIVWFKPVGMGDLKSGYSPSHEFLIYAIKGRHKSLRGKRIGNVWSVPTDPPSTYEHPTQKPVALMLLAIQKSTDPGDLVLDLTWALAPLC